MEPDNSINNKMGNLIKQFEDLDGKEKLEFFKFIIEKMENGEVEINGKEIYPVNVGIEDGYRCCREIAKLVK